MQNTALITGASSGIGLEFAKIHAERGGDLVLVARSEDKLRRLADELSKAHRIQSLVIVADLADPAAPQAVFDQVEKAGVDVDILINNAGFGGRGKFHEQDWSAHKSMLAVNIDALTHLSHLFVPVMVRRGSGRVLNVSSTASLVPGPMQSVYHATKAYVTFLSNGMAEELRGSGVSVTALLPGATETGFAKRADMDGTEGFAKTAAARDVALAGYDAMLKGELEVIEGLTTAQRIMMAFVPIMPKRVLLKQLSQFAAK